MIRAHFQRDDAGDFQSFRITGHAESAPHGEDLVCAGVSALVVACENSLTLQGVDIETTADDEGVFVALKPNNDEKQKLTGNIIVYTLLIGLKAIAASDDEKYLEVLD